MIKTENHLGEIHISQNYLKKLIGHTAARCFGVVGMDDCSALQRIKTMMKSSDANNGVTIRTKNNRLIIDLHILVSYGVNISAVSDSIVNKVRFAVENEAGIDVFKVNVFIEHLKS